MGLHRRLFFYFAGWIFLALAATALNVLNIDWEVTPLWQGILLTIVLGVLQGSVLELVVITIATLIVRCRPPGRPARAVCDNSTLILNYNLLAMAKDDVDETYRRMYEAYMGNLHPNVVAVLVSATNDETLKNYELYVRDNYRAMIFDVLKREGMAFAEGDHRNVDPFRLLNVWKNFSHLDMRTFVRDRLDNICQAYAQDFMCLHRVSRVLRKCGQYQDLMLLSEGDRLAFTYTDCQLYSKKARPYGEPLFHDTPDVENICGRRFHYTLVLDGDTRVPPGTALEILSVAAANPESAIIQPAIIMDVAPDDTMYMHLERMRQNINAPVTNALAEVLGQSGYYGKAMIKNSTYIAKVIGTRDSPIERVPIDVLSHDTFEAAVLKPRYVSSAALYEAPPLNYVTWNIRERRWNKGEILLAMYFWPNIFGKPTRWLQSLVQGSDFVRTTLRTHSKLDLVSSYNAHSALRQMFMKPLLLLFVLLHINVHLHHAYISIAVMMFLVIVFPKFATCTRTNIHQILLETLASIFQFTPEAVVGCVRIVKAYHGNISKCCKWTPQRAVEEEFRRKNPLLSSMKHLWGYSLAALLAAVAVGIWARQAVLIYIMFVTLFVLPFCTGLTSYTPSLKRVPLQGLATYRDNMTTSTESLGSIGHLSFEELAGFSNPVVTVL